jgi:peptidoglycan hydrolase CwlO-like protein
MIVTSLQEMLQNKITSFEQTLTVKTAESEKESNDLHQQLQQTKAEVQNSQDQCSKLDGLAKEKDEKLGESLQKCGDLEADLKVKVRFMLSLSGIDSRLLMILEF